MWVTPRVSTSRGHQESECETPEVQRPHIGPPSGPRGLLYKGKKKSCAWLLIGKMLPTRWGDCDSMR